jgi:hypothetical protein
MKKILVTGAGGAPAEGVINSLLKAKEPFEIIGMGSDPSDLILSKAQKKYLVDYASDAEYKEEVLKVIAEEHPDFAFFINDLETWAISPHREEIHALGTKTFMPRHEVIETCVNKYNSYLKWKAAGVKVPENIFIRNEQDLKDAFRLLGNEQGMIWLRAASVGGGGKGAVPTNDFDFAKAWINRYNGWNDFLAAELLTPTSVTFTSVWNRGSLVVAQTRIRKSWAHSSRTVSGITGVTKVGKTMSDTLVTEVALNAVAAIDDAPHGIYSVDMDYDREGIPNPTEINISRFFTTILFFTEAGVNMPEIVVNLALKNEKPSLSKIINPLHDGLLWMRGMDTEPLLIREEDLFRSFINLKHTYA